MADTNALIFQRSLLASVEQVPQGGMGSCFLLLLGFPRWKGMPGAQVSALEALLGSWFIL